MVDSAQPGGAGSGATVASGGAPVRTRRLLCITGLTPQVITETVYALMREGADSMPNEIHVLSTAEGINRAHLMLLTDEPGWFNRLCRDYRLPPIRFDAGTLHVLTGASGHPLEDIRSDSDSRAAADGITEWVRRFTADPDSELHVSLAGGRKTMGFFAGYALSLFGRAQDRLSHVLVDSPFESHPGFFYPTPYPHVIYAPPPDQRPLDAQQARVALANLPFVCLRDGLPEHLQSGRATFTETVAAAQRVLADLQVTLDVGTRELIAAGVTLNLAPADFAFYLWFARRRLEELPGVRWTDDGLAEEYCTVYREACGEWADTDRVESALSGGISKDWFDQRKSKTNRALVDALGRAVATPYLVTGTGARPHTRYGLSLDPGSIRIV